MTYQISAVLCTVFNIIEGIGTRTTFQILDKRDKVHGCASYIGKPSHNETMHWLYEGSVRGVNLYPFNRAWGNVSRGGGGLNSLALRKVRSWSLIPDEFPLYEPIFY